MTERRQTVGQLLGRCLLGLGATRVFGMPLPGLDHVPIADPSLASLLADADGRCGSGPGVSLADDLTLRLSSKPGALVDAMVVTDTTRMAGALATWTIGETLAAREFRLDLDLAGPTADDAEPLVLDDQTEMYSLSPALADLHTVVLAGPGVVRSGQVDALVAFAAQSGAGVFNTWGAKGVFAWDSPFHLGTGGLQERDFDLAGFGDAEMIIAVGIDEDESPRQRWEFTQTLDVEPYSLAALAFNWAPPERMPERPPLYSQLFDALSPEYSSDSLPLAPARAAGDLAAALPDGGLVVADPGPAGLWVARAFPTREPGSVIVPATVAEGFAVAAAIVAALDDRPVVAVTTDPVDETTAELLALARSLELNLVIEVWGAEAEFGSADDHAAGLAAALVEPGVSVVPVPVDFSRTKVLVGVAGPVVAWGA